MHYNLQLKKGGILISKDWDSELGDYIEQSVRDEEVGYYIHNTICFESLVTIKDVLLLISRNIQLFLNITSCSFIKKLLDEAFSQVGELSERNDMFAVQIERKFNLNNENSNLYLYYDCYGLGEKEQYSIAFSPINELIHYPLILNENVNIKKGEDVDFSVKMKFSLFDVVRCLVDELSCAGPPNLKSYILNEFKNVSIDETYKSITFEELEKKMKEDDDKNKKPCKLCGEDSRSQMFNKPANICEKCFNKMKEN